MVQNEKNRNCKQKPLLLFSPLDWGFGHTTRCIPLVRKFQELGWSIAVACNSTQKDILAAELTNISFHHLGGYDVVYGSSGSLTRLQLGLQLNKILTRIKAEKAWLQRFLAENQVAAVLSDNRYGFCDHRVPSIFVTHQLNPATGLGRVADRLIQKYLYRFINRFDECWIPDASAGDNISGILSHTQLMPRIPVHYMGPLSRLQPVPEDTNLIHELLIVLSGPEPQRSILERTIMQQLGKNRESTSRIVLVRGLPSAKENVAVNIEGVQCINYVNGAQLSQLASQSRFVLCRSGYTSLMDMIKLKKKMILVPTPGQGEQEYLAKYFKGKQYAPMMQQHSLRVDEAFSLAHSFPYRLPSLNMEAFSEVITAFHARLLTHNTRG